MQMADPLTALIHAVQVMNFLKTLIMKTLREREEAAAESMALLSCSESPTDNGGFNTPEISENTESLRDEAVNLSAFDRASFSKFLFGNEDSLDCDLEENFHSFEKSGTEDSEFISGRSSPFKCDLDAFRDETKSGFCNGDPENLLDRFSFREGIRKLCRHPVFQLSRSTKKPNEVVIVCSGD